MPAIRFHHQCVFQIADAHPCQAPVDVRRKDGSFVRMRWLGMICEHAAEKIAGLGYAKIVAHEVSPDTDVFPRNWRRLEAGEYVLGWRVQITNSSQAYDQAVYGIVDDHLWPVVVGARGRKGAPRSLKIVSAAGGSI